MESRNDNQTLKQPLTESEIRELVELAVIAMMQVFVELRNPRVGNKYTYQYLEHVLTEEDIQSFFTKLRGFHQHCVNAWMDEVMKSAQEGKSVILPYKYNSGAIAKPIASSLKKVGLASPLLVEPRFLEVGIDFKTKKITLKKNNHSEIIELVNNPPVTDIRFPDDETTIEEVILSDLSKAAPITHENLERIRDIAYNNQIERFPPPLEGTQVDRKARLTQFLKDAESEIMNQNELVDNMYMKISKPAVDGIYPSKLYRANLIIKKLINEFYESECNLTLKPLKDHIEQLNSEIAELKKCGAFMSFFYSADKQIKLKEAKRDFLQLYANKIKDNPGQSFADNFKQTKNEFNGDYESVIAGTFRHKTVDALKKYVPEELIKDVTKQPTQQPN